MKKLCFLLAILILLTGCTGPELSDPNAPCKTHADTNNDGLCDRCQEVVVVSFDVYAINDLHGKFADADTHPGVDELSTYFRQAQASTDNVILLSSGDAWQGSSESNLTGGVMESFTRSAVDARRLSMRKRLLKAMRRSSPS